MAAPTGVVFDLDGVLALTSQMHARIWDEFVDEVGYPQLRAYVRQPGRRAADVLRELIPDIAGDVVDSHVVGMRNRFRELLLESPAPLSETSTELIGWLSARVPVGIATSSNRETAELLLGPLVDLVAVVVTSDDCVNGKPDPEPYRRAVKALGLNCEHDIVVAVEDTPAGVRAATAAGLETWTVVSTVDAEQLLTAGARYAMTDLAGIGSLLRQRLSPPAGPATTG